MHSLIAHLSLCIGLWPIYLSGHFIWNVSLRGYWKTLWEKHWGPSCTASCVPGNGGGTRVTGDLAFVCKACHSEIPQTRRLRSQTFISSCIWRPEVQDQVPVQLIFSEASVLALQLATFLLPWIYIYLYIYIYIF